MKKNNFTDEDSKKVVEYLNFIAKNAKFELNTQEVIDYFSLISYMQKILLTKIKDNIFEITKIVENKSLEDNKEE